MRVGNRITSVASVAVLLLNVAAASGQDDMFVDITDAVPGRFFSAAKTAPDPNSPNRLIIGFDNGRDPATWKANDFRASTAAFSHLSAMDTISFRIVAPDGYYVKTVTYRQRGSGSIVRTGKALGGTNWVVGDYAADLGTFASEPDVAQTVDLTESYLSLVPVSITTGMYAFATPTAGSATVSLTNAEVVVELAEVPKPTVEEAPVDELPAPPADEPAPPADQPPPAPPVDEPPPAPPADEPKPVPPGVDP